MDSFSKELTIFREGVIAALYRARTPSAITNVVQRIITDLGFSHFDITYINRHDSDLSVVLTSIPQQMLDIYFNEGFEKDDLTNEYLSGSEKPLYFYELYKHLTSCPGSIKRFDRSALIYELMNNYDFYDSYSCPAISVNNGNKLIFSIEAECTKPSEFRKLVSEYRAEINSLSGIIYNKLQGSVYIPSDTQKPEGTDLTPKQIAILEAMSKHSMTQTQAAEHTGLAEATVRTYCKIIKEKLGKPTLIGALFEAQRRGIITTD